MGTFFIRGESESETEGFSRLPATIEPPLIRAFIKCLTVDAESYIRAVPGKRNNFIILNVAGSLHLQTVKTCQVSQALIHDIDKVYRDS